MGVQMLILPFECNQQLIWKGKKNNHKVVVPAQALQEIIAHSEHLHAPTADLAFATDLAETGLGAEGQLEVPPAGGGLPRVFL